MSHGGKEGEFLCSLTSASRLLCLSLGSAAASCLIQVASNAEAQSGDGGIERRWMIAVKIIDSVIVHQKMMVQIDT